LNGYDSVAGVTNPIAIGIPAVILQPRVFKSARAWLRSMPSIPYLYLQGTCALGLFVLSQRFTRRRIRRGSLGREVPSLRSSPNKDNGADKREGGDPRAPYTRCCSLCRDAKRVVGEPRSKAREPAKPSRSKICVCYS